ncbi:hypothetical protein FH972_021295 [Carpinus fangiana]|uniref:Uncharacterized protein n=1 Tax=Carpinus fangiana TaxID=176857 RepID=A0A5N6KNZ9_9ROSI|nr:hypothetical protein FH972_021295 [Carpinus fangiana]
MGKPGGEKGIRQRPGAQRLRASRERRGAKVRVSKRARRLPSFSANAKKLAYRRGLSLLEGRVPRKHAEVSERRHRDDKSFDAWRRVAICGVQVLMLAGRAAGAAGRSSCGLHLARRWRSVRARRGLEVCGGTAATETPERVAGQRFWTELRAKAWAWANGRPQTPPCIGMSGGRVCARLLARR